jgi:hypothetical protein
MILSKQRTGIPLSPEIKNHVKKKKIKREKYKVSNAHSFKVVNMVREYFKNFSPVSMMG